LKKADLLTVSDYLIGHLSYSQVPTLAKRHKVEAKKESASAQELLAKQVSKFDESELCKLLLEISLLDSAYQRSTTSPNDILMDVAKRYRVDSEKLQKAVADELVAKREKKTKPKAKTGSKKTTSNRYRKCLWRSASLHSAALFWIARPSAHCHQRTALDP
jgi:hypothetical protein